MEISNVYKINFNDALILLNDIGINNCIIIDSRSNFDFNKGHLEGAVNIDAKNNFSLINLHKYLSQKFIFIYCEYNIRSEIIVSQLMKLKYMGLIYFISEGFSKYWNSGNTK